MFMLLVSCSGSREFKPAFNQPLQPVMQPGFVYVDQVAPLVKTNLKYAGYDNFVGRPLDGYHGRRAILRTQAAQALKKVSEDLYRQGYLLEIYDAYRPHTAVLDICKWGTDDGDQKMKSRYYPHIDKAKVFGDHYVRDFSEHSRGVAVDVYLLYAKTGKPVVVLIDEYDAPLLDSNSDALLQQQLRNEMRKFFSPLKGLGQYLRFLFITGISKFSQLSIFSELNNLQNISMRDDFSALCGITEEELLTQLKPDIERMAEANDETYEEACLHLKRQYDGYHFSKACADIYNPFSLFNAFNSKEYKNYWFSTGTPTFLIDILRHADFDVRALEGVEATDEQFDAPTEQITSPIPVLYQSGYLTIKGYDRNFQFYRLAYPNGEVRKGFIESLLPSYVHLPAQNNTFYVVSFLRDLMKGDVESCLERTRSFFASIPNDLENKTEKHYQTIFYLLFRLMGQYVESEVKSSVGRADVVVQLQDVVYVFEFKYDGTPEEALAQIDSKQYAIPYRADGRRVVKIGVNFDSSTRTIGGWKIAKAD